MAKIAFFGIEKWEIAYIRKNLQGHTFSFFTEPLAKKHLSRIKKSDVLAVFIYSQIDEKILEHLPNLKLVTTMSTGFDHIDLEACRKKKVTVCNVPTYGANTVAEHAFGLLLTISRRITEGIDRTRKGDFNVQGIRGFDLKDKTLGVIGTGNIGRHLIRMAKGFEMKVIAYDAFPNPKAAKQLDFKYVTMERLLKQSDVISLHVPLLKATQHMINAKAIRKMKKGVVLINTARGGLIDTGALIKGLNKGSIAAAGLDVLEGECFIKEEKQLLHKKFLQACDLKIVMKDHVLLKKKNVYITPHNAFNSNEALLRILDTTIENIKSFLKNKPVNVIRPP